MFTKTIQAGPVALEFSEANETITMKASMSAQAGGGEAAGFLKGTASMEVDLEAGQVIDLGFALAEAKFPAVAQYLKLAQAEIHALLQKA